MKIALYSGQTAGMLIMSSILALGHTITLSFPDDEKNYVMAKNFNLPIEDKALLNTKDIINKLSHSIDLFICCHGWKILSKDFVRSFQCINFHPCLYAYKGLHPIARLIKDGNSKASVATHWITEEIDAGSLIMEKFITISDVKNKKEADIYNELYPLYTHVLIKSLTFITKKRR